MNALDGFRVSLDGYGGNTPAERDTLDGVNQLFRVAVLADKVFRAGEQPKINLGLLAVEQPHIALHLPVVACFLDFAFGFFAEERVGFNIPAAFGINDEAVLGVVNVAFAADAVVFAPLGVFSVLPAAYQAAALDGKRL